MKYTLTSSILAIAAVMAAPASAQSGPTFQYSGEIGVEALMSNGAAPFYIAYADVNLDYAFATLASGVVLGFDLSLDGLSHESFSVEVVHGSFYADFGAHRVSIGYPQGSFATYRGNSVMGASAYLSATTTDLYFAPLTDYFQFFADKYAPGVRYDGSFGNWSVSGSYNQADLGGAELKVFEAAVEYRVSDAFAVWASATSGDFGGGSMDAYSAGVTGNVGSFEYAASYVESDLIGGQSLVEANVWYHFNDNFEVGLGGMWPSGGGTVTTAVSAEYGFADRFFIRGMVATIGSSDPVTSVSAGITF